MTKTMKVLMPTALALFISSAAHAGVSFDTPHGKLNIGGDVELDLTADNHNGTGFHEDTQNLGGRVLLDINGERVLANNTFAGFKLNPTWNAKGGSGQDDVWFAFGVKNDWSVKLGYFEAYDLSPAGQDTYVVTLGDQIYRANFARGRDSNGGGQLMVNKEMGQWYGELSAMIGDTSELYSQDISAANSPVKKNKDPVLVRPVLAWSDGTYTVAGGAEFNLVTDAYVEAATQESVSDWIGYGLTGSAKLSDDVTVSLRGAYQDNQSAGVDKYSVGPGLQYQNFYISYLYGKAEPVLNEATNTHVTYASYKIPTVMGIDNFDMYLGVSYGSSNVEDKDDQYGARARFKYYF